VNTAPGLRLRSGKTKWEGMHNEVETNGTGSKVDVNLFLSSTFCLLVLLTAFIRLDSNWAPSHQEWPFL